MSHLHVPDGVLPLWFWLAAWALTLVLLARGGHASPQRIAYQGALGALVLAAMAVPLGPLEIHLTLAGPLGVLLGPAAAFPVAFAVSALLAFVGHGGITVIGVNTLVLGAAAVAASWTYRALGARARPEWAMTAAAAAGQLVSGVLWVAVLGLAAGALGGWERVFDAGHAGAAAHAHAAPPAGGAHLGAMAAIAVPLWLLSTLAETAAAWGLGRFLGRVHPALLPGAPSAPRDAAAEGTP